MHFIFSFLFNQSARNVRESTAAVPASRFPAAQPERDSAVGAVNPPAVENPPAASPPAAEDPVYHVDEVAAYMPVNVGPIGPLPGADGTTPGEDSNTEDDLADYFEDLLCGHLRPILRHPEDSAVNAFRLGFHEARGLVETWRQQGMY